ncbi:MAG: hypothetical protein KDA60_17455 [Planctomycetales bacterium]|nr:hypothetical protein [Planctomycetales bacterium]
MHDITQVFDITRTLFFPGWDKDRQWSASWLDNIPGGTSTFCDESTKTICMNERHHRGMSAVEFMAIMIHEICHVAGGAKHGTDWCNRLYEVVKTAEAIGDLELASELRWHICGYATDEIREGMSEAWITSSLNAHLGSLTNDEIEEFRLRDAFAYLEEAGIDRDPSSLSIELALVIQSAKCLEAERVT